LPEFLNGDGFGFTSEDMSRHPLFMESTGSDIEGNAAFEAIQALLLDDPPEGKPESIPMTFTFSCFICSCCRKHEG
jgi:hypothetical protein